MNREEELKKHNERAKEWHKRQSKGNLVFWVVFLGFLFIFFTILRMLGE